MKSVSIKWAQANLPDLLREVEAGHELHLTRNNKTIARIVPMPPVTLKSDWTDTFERIDKIFGGKRAPGKPGTRILKDGRR